MLIGLHRVRGCDIAATDGKLGKSHDFYFDDHVWTIRYLVVDTGWLFGRKILLAPTSVETIDAAGGEISVALTKKQIESGPGAGTDLPVSRQQEMSLRDYYDWPEYWETFPSGMAAAPLVATIGPRATAKNPAKNGGEAPAESDVDQRGDPHLRSAREVEGYDIEAKDGTIGHVEDFVIDQESWTVRYVVVDTRNWLPGRKVLAAPRWAEGIDWAGGRLRLALDREAVKNGPPYDPNREISRDYELSIHEHFGRKPYWA